MARVPISQKDSCVDQLEHLSRIPRDAGLALLGEVRQLLAATHPQTADTPHVFQIPSHRTVRHTHVWHAAHRLSRVLTRSS